MGKYHGHIGYGFSSETRPGIWQNTIIEKEVFGDVLRNTKRTENSGKVNDDITIMLEISFLMDAYAQLNFHLIKYATYMGTAWKVTSVDVVPPRINLTLGGVYDGPKA